MDRPISAAMLERALLSLSCVACFACATASPPFFFCPAGTEAASTQRKLELSDAPPIDVVFCRKPDGTLHGPFAQWIQGQLWTAGNYRDGRLHGIAYEWLDGGLRGAETEWERGEMRRVIRWNEAGVATFEQVTIGEEEFSTTRYESGALKAKITWRGDDTDGPFEAWYESGQKRLEGRYERGRRIGAWTCWDEQGAALHANYDAAGQPIGLDADAAAAWQGCLRPIGSEAPSAPETPAAIE